MVLYPEDIIDAGATESSDECAGLCYASDGCRGFTWYDNTTALPNRCFLFTICEDTLPCQHCISGRISCIASPQCYNYKILDEESRNVNRKAMVNFVIKRIMIIIVVLENGKELATIDSSKLLES